MQKYDFVFIQNVQNGIWLVFVARQEGANSPPLGWLVWGPLLMPPPPSDGLVYTPGLIHHRARARPARVSVSRNSIKMRNLIPGEQQQLFKYWNACCAAPALINNIMYKAIHNINYESSMQVLFSAKLS